MINRRMMCFLTICQIVSGNSESVRRNFVLMKVIGRTLAKNHEYAPAAASQPDNRCNYNCITPNDSSTKFLNRTRARSTDGSTNGTAESDELEPPPSAKFSIFNLLSDDEEAEDDGSDSETDEKAKNEEKGEEEEEKEDEDDDDDDIDFFGSEEEISSDKLEGTKAESLLKQYHRQNLRLHSFVFPLLMAYKLKFFTVIPMLLGALVLLVGTTGIAGFFFALFAAALGIHVKSHDQ